MTIRTHILALACIFILGCGAKQKAIEPPVIMHWSGDSIPDAWVRAWYVEASRRFPNPVIVACHGHTVGVVGKDGKVEKVWTAVADPPRRPIPVQQIAEVMANIYPDRDIVYICCNEGGHKVTVPRAWVAPTIVWAMPDSYPFASLFREAERGKGFVGDIFEFTNGDRVRLAGER